MTTSDTPSRDMTKLTAQRGPGGISVTYGNRNAVFFESGDVAVIEVVDGKLRCPHCKSGNSLVAQEYVYSTRDIPPELSDGVIIISGYSEEDGEAGEVDGLMPAAMCRHCVVGLELPPGLEIDYS